MDKLIIIDFDGYNVGFSDCFGEMYLEFNKYDAFLICKHWNEWICAELKKEKSK